jgi:serpin B
MARPNAAGVLRHLHQLFRSPGADDQPDVLLLRRFLARRDEEAFAALVQRHGPPVLRLCRRVLRDEQDAEDAFQATFFVLARKAGSLRRQERLAGWLCRVAFRIALQARARAARRRAHEQQVAARAPEAVLGQADLFEVWPVLHEEVDRLPAKYRVPVVLCYLDGKTNEEAAQQLGWPVGTLKTRLARAREVLRGRLTHRGLAPATAALGALAESTAPAAVPVALLAGTARAALVFAGGKAAPAGAVPVAAAALAKGALRTMFLSKFKTGMVVVLALALLGGGAGLLWPAGQAAGPPPAPPQPAVAAPAKPPAAPDAAQVKADKAAVVRGNTAFALDLYGRLRTKDGNLFCSPYSISTALAMTYAGARGRTAEQMAKVLHFPVGQDRLHPACAALVRDTSAGSKDYQLRVANSLWGQKGHPFLKDFLSLTREHYGAGLQEVDYVGDTEAARRAINAWVQKQTQDKIKDLLRPGVLTRLTRLVLTNAIFFQGNWQSPFPKGATRDQPFFVTPANKPAVPLMCQQGRFSHLDGGTFQAAELPYQGKDLSMVLLLPKKVDGLAELEKSLTAANLDAWLKKMRPREVQVFLPRFKTTGQFRLNADLAALGMPDAFRRGVADFSGMDGESGRLYIHAVVHKGFVEVTESGTTAAAATAVVPGDPQAPPPAVDFRADHPFVFLIRDNRSGSVLFLGRLVDPRE